MSLWDSSDPLGQECPCEMAMLLWESSVPQGWQCPSGTGVSLWAMPGLLTQSGMSVTGQDTALGGLSMS
ncbi:hypothetical protein Nmel_011971, partial [Mimus melanotis]